MNTLIEPWWPRSVQPQTTVVARYVSERSRGGKPLRLSFVDIRKAYFNALPERDIYMRLPKEMGLPPNLVAKQVRCVYGTRDAGKLWEDTYTQVLEGMGFTTGVSNPCVFYHAERELSIVIHGDDFTTLGTDANIDWYEAELQKHFEIKIRGRLGEGCEGTNQIRILNRVVTITPEGLQYEADPRHGDLLTSSLSLSETSHAATPGVKPMDRDEHAEKSDEPDQINLLDYSNPDQVIAAILNSSDSKTQNKVPVSPAPDGPAKCAKVHSSSDSPRPVDAPPGNSQVSDPKSWSGCGSSGSTTSHAPAFATRISPLAFLTDTAAATVSAAIYGGKSDFDITANLGVNLVSPLVSSSSIHGPTKCAKRFAKYVADTWLENGEDGAYTRLLNG